MARHGGGHFGGGDSAIADRVGLFTAITLLGGFAMAVFMIFKHPKIAMPCIIAAAIFTGICPSPTEHPLLGLAALFVGASLVKGN